MFAELGIEPSAFAVANHYNGIITKFVLDEQDADWADQIQTSGIRAYTVNTVMKSNADRLQLAQDVLNFIEKD
jgi:LPPG:FO 2-phospho-L-lactate transferase